MDISGGGEAAMPIVRRRRLLGNPAPIEQYNRKGRGQLLGNARRVAPRLRYFQDPALQRRYYGVKRQIGYRKRYSLRDFWDMPIQRGSQASLDLVGPSFKQATEQQRMNRRSYNMTGRGLYRGRGGYFGRLLGGLVGQPELGDKLGDAAWNIGSRFIPTPAKMIGDAVFGVTDKMTGQGLYRGKGIYKGRGEYAVNKVIHDSGATASEMVPKFSPTDVHEITYSNREYVRDIYGPGAGIPFTIQTMDLNPGLVSTFPWLSQVAINFEEYELVQLIFTYRSTVADFASASGQVGQILMCTQYNPNSDAFANKEEMMLYDGGMSCKTTQSMQHGVECDPLKNAGAASKYVRVGALPPTEDLKNYDLGKTSIAVVNVPSQYQGQQLGELWVSYTVKLRKPKFASGDAYNVQRDVYAMPLSQALIGTASVTYLNPAILPMIGARNSLGTTIAFPQDGTIAPTGAGTDLLRFPTAAANTVNANTIFTLTFPPSYSGIIRIRWIIYNVTTDQQFYLAPITRATETIKRFKDIPVPYSINQAGLATSTPSWSHFIASAQEVSGGATSGTGDLEIHLRLLPSQNNVPNTIHFATTNLSNPSNYRYWVEVSQYNSFLSVKDDGTDDRLNLVQNGAPAQWA